MLTRPINVINGKTLITGNDYGPYPLHEFLVLAHADQRKYNYPLFLFSAGYDTWHKKCFRRKQNPETFSAELVVEGVFVFKQHNSVHHIHPGEMFFPQFSESWEMSCETTYAKKRTIIMGGKMLESILSQLGLNKMNFLKPQNLEPIHKIYNAIEELCTNQSESGFFDACSLCYKMLLELATQANANAIPADLRRAVEFMHEHIFEHLSIRQICHHTGLSSATLHRLFRNNLQLSPMDYFLKQKMERAKELLYTGDYSIKEIAAKLHYSSPQYFATEFRKRFGISPSTFCTQK